MGSAQSQNAVAVAKRLKQSWQRCCAALSSLPRGRDCSSMSRNDRVLHSIVLYTNNLQITIRCALQLGAFVEDVAPWKLLRPNSLAY